jgi:ER lumen protein retaining receptor
MNLFRGLGDFFHVLAIVLLLMKIWKSKSAAGISGKSQVLFTLVYITRYLDVFVSFISWYNTLMKLLFVTASCTTVYLIFHKFKATYDGNHDTCKVQFLVPPCIIMALVCNYEFTFLEIMWAFSIYLEALAIMPQLFMLTKTQEAENITSHYLFALGAYRAFYIMNWVYRYMYDEHHWDPIAVFSGILQTLLYIDFFYLYVSYVMKGKKIQMLP